MSRYIDRAELFNRLSDVKTLAAAMAVIQDMPDAETKNVPDTNVGDMISRQAAIDALGEEPEVWTKEDEYAQGLKNQWHYDINALKAVPPAQPTGIQDILEYLDTELHPVVSPEKWHIYSALYDMVSALPSAERHGRWLDVEPAPFNLFYATCSVCGNRQTLEVAKYCPNCGASMTDEVTDGE